MSIKSENGPSIKVLIGVSSDGITSIELIQNPPKKGFEWEIASGKASQRLETMIDRWMRDYCRKKQPKVNLPLVLDAFPPYTSLVLSSLQQITFGKTISYKELASKTGNPRGARAVGNACGRNPCLLVIPCHRVLASKGVGGFSSGLEIKQALLDFEQSKGNAD